MELTNRAYLSVQLHRTKVYASIRNPPRFSRGGFLSGSRLVDCAVVGLGTNIKAEVNKTISRRA